MRLNLSVEQRIGLGFSLLFLMVLVGGGIGLIFATRNFTTVSHTQGNLDQIEEMAELERRWFRVASTVDRMLLTRQTSLTERELQPQLADFNEQLQTLAAVGSEHDSPVLGSQGQVEALSSELNEVVRQIAAAAEQGRWARAQTLRHTELASFQRRFNTELSDLTSDIESDVNVAVSDSRQAVSVIRVSWIILVFFSLATALAIAIEVTRSVIQPVKQLTESAGRLAAGSFGERVPMVRQDEIGQLAAAFNQMAAQLQTSYGELERRVAERTQALETSMEVSRRLSTILEPEELVGEVVRQIRTAFDYYHVHIYLIDEAGRYLDMVGGTGEAGRRMLTEGHRIPLGKGLVGWAGRQKETVLVPDVAQAPDWLPNPLLPETKAEVAVPIMFAGDLLGVLDVQENEVAGLDQEDVGLLQSIASQVAVAFQNARLLAQAEQRAKHAATLNAIGQKIQRATSVEGVLAVAAQELGQALPVKKAHIQLVNPQKAIQSYGKSEDLNGNDTSNALQRTPASRRSGRSK